MWFPGLFAGAGAGLTVDLILFPIDTLKTRIQAHGGLANNGGIRGIYRGFGSVLLGSAPGASLFFCTYESIKSWKVLSEHAVLKNILATSLGEIAACIVRVPTDVIKQRTQVNQYKSSFAGAFEILQTKSFRELYRGWWSTIAREIPFACIQFPLWEYLRSSMANYRAQNSNKSDAKKLPTTFESSIAGMVAGGTAAALTTPLDVIRTRIILQRNSKIPTSRFSMAKDVLRNKLLFAGIVHRTICISLGGAIFLGVYDTLSKFEAFLRQQNVRDLGID